MRTRTIVILVVAGLALLFLPQLGRSSGEGAAPAQPDSQAEPEVAVEPAPIATATSQAPPPPPTTTLPPTTAPPEIERRGMGDPVASRWPLVELLPKDAPGWRIDYRVEAEGLVLVVTLRAVLNRPDQLEAYRTALGTYKAQALDWLRSAGADPGAYVIEWRPPERPSSEGTSREPHARASVLRLLTANTWWRRGSVPHRQQRGGQRMSSRFELPAAASRGEVPGVLDRLDERAGGDPPRPPAV